MYATRGLLPKPSLGYALLLQVGVLAQREHVRSFGLVGRQTPANEVLRFGRDRWPRRELNRNRLGDNLRDAEASGAE